MARPDYPTTWIPYLNSKDCSQGFCSMYCPQWCYIIYPPPPPPTFQYPDDDSKPYFSPLVIAIMGILATAFLLLTYYTLISKYCGRRESSRGSTTDPVEDFAQNRRENCQVSTFGLDDVQIKSIAVFKYRKGDSFFAGTVTDCSVCLSEFQDDESVRLLPMCNHVFHLPCIDTWLKSNSSCPLCRANIFTLNASTLHVSVPVPPTVIEFPSRNETFSEDEQIVVEETRMHHHRRLDSKALSLRAFSDLCNLQGGRERIIEIRDDVCRSVSMDHSFENGYSISDVLNMNQEGDFCEEGCSMDSSKRLRGESSKSRYKRKVLHCVKSPIAMKRSFSSGNFPLAKIDRGTKHEIFHV